MVWGGNIGGAMVSSCGKSRGKARGVCEGPAHDGYKLMSIALVIGLRRSLQTPAVPAKRDCHLYLLHFNTGPEATTSPLSSLKPCLRCPRCLSLISRALLQLRPHPIHLSPSPTPTHTHLIFNTVSASRSCLTESEAGYHRHPFDLFTPLHTFWQ